VTRQLSKTLSLPAGIALAITMVIGGGMLVIPGIAFATYGSSAIWAWVLCAAAIAPVLFVFAMLGARFPGAGGVTLFVQAAFSRRAGAATEVLILGTAPAGAALLIVAGGYAAAATSTGRLGRIVGVAVTAVIVALVNYSGGRISGKVSQALAATMVVALATISILALMANDAVGSFDSPPSGIAPILQASALVFFAFVGWELLSFTTEEFRNPRRDFPLSIAISYVVVVLLYVLIAYAIQHALLPSGPLVASAPFVALIGTTGIKHAQTVIGALGYLIALANVIAAVWAFSRLLFASSREGLMPVSLSRLSERTKVPGNSVAVVLVVLLVFSILQLAGFIPLDLLFKLAGACFLAAYILACVSFIKIGKGRASRLIAGLALVVSALILYGFGYLVIYPVALFALSYLLIGLRGGAGGTRDTA